MEVPTIVVEFSSYPGLQGWTRRWSQAQTRAKARGQSYENVTPASGVGPMGETKGELDYSSYN